MNLGKNDGKNNNEQCTMSNEKEHRISRSPADSDKLKSICPRYDTHPFLPLPNVTGEQKTGSHRRFEAVFFQAQRLYVGLYSKSRDRSVDDASSDICMLPFLFRCVLRATNS